MVDSYRMLLSPSQRELIVHVILIALVIFVTMYAVMLLRRRAEVGRGAMPSSQTAGGGSGGSGGGDTDEMFTTAKLLHAANATIYGSRQCGYTVRQMERFGSHADMVEYIECGGEQSACEGIRGFPTWKIGSETLMGDQPLRTLRAAAERVLNNSQPSAAAPQRQRHPSPADDDESSDGLLAMGADDDAFHPTL